MAGASEEAERLFDLCPDLLSVSDFEGGFVRVNAAWTRTLGWSRAELLGNPYLDFVHPDDVARTEEAGALLADGQALTGFENRYRHRDGGYRWLSWDATSDVVARRMYAAVRDITELRRREGLQRQTEVITGVGTWELEVDTEQLRWSQVTHRIHGTDPATFEPGLVDALRFYPADGRVRVEAALEALMDQGVPYDLELPFVTVDDDARWVRTTATALRFDGQVMQVFGTIQDITDLVAERARLRRSHDLLELSEEGIAEISPDGIVHYANARLAAMAGIESAELLVGEPAAILLHPHDAPAATAWLLERIRFGDEVVRGEVRLGPAEASTWAQVAVRIERGTGATTGYATAVFTDITAQKRREQAFAEATALLEEAQELASIGHWSADVVTGAVEASAVVHQILGTSPGRLVVADYLAMIPGEDRTRVPSRLSDLSATEPVDVVHRIEVDGRGERAVHLRATVSADDSGRLVTARGTIQDVTDLHHTQLTLERVLRATNDGWWDEDLVDGTGVYSDRWWEIHGLTPVRGPVPGGTWRNYVPAPELERVEVAFARAVADRSPSFVLSGHVRHTAGYDVPVIVRGTIEYDLGGRPIRISGATSDVTEERRATQAKEVFVSTVSHELRTPLTAIGGALELLSEGRGGILPASAGGLIDVARRNTGRLQALIDDLLDVEQLRTGAVNMHLAAQSIGPIVSTAVEDLAAVGDARAVTLVTELVDPALVVRCDAHRIAQVVANLVSNAVKYSPDGAQVRVVIARHDARARVEVQDQGPGVPAGFRERAFERFAQAEPDDPRSRGGTGLGLAISREIIHQHGGLIDYRSEPGNTCFWFELPAVSG